MKYKTVPCPGHKSRFEKMMNYFGWYSETEMEESRKKLQETKDKYGVLHKKYQKAYNFLTWNQRKSVEGH